MIRYHIVLVLLTIYLIPYGKSSSNENEVSNGYYSLRKNAIDSNDQSNEGNPSPQKDDCRDTEFKCRFTGECVKMSLVCDGNKNCVDGTDELNCIIPNNESTIDFRKYFKKGFKTETITKKKANMAQNLSTMPFTELIKKAKKLFTMNSFVNEVCKRDYDSYNWHLLNQTTWAVKMMESTEWPSSRFFEGRTIHFGDYEECLSVSSGRFNGQYCLAEVVLNYLPDPIRDENTVNNSPEDVSAWNIIKMYRNNPISGNEQKMKFAVCIPSSCQPNDLAKSLNDTLINAFLKTKFGVSVHVSPASCKTRDKQNIFPSEFYVVSLLFLIIFSLVILSTSLDVTSNPSRNQDNNNNPSLTVIYESFSIVKNFKKLKHIDENDHSLYFTRVVIIVFIIYGHRFLYATTSAQLDVETVQKMWKWPKIETLYEGITSVCFMISGFLMFHRYSSDTKRSGCVFLLVNLLSRWMKLIPMVCIFVLYIKYILPYTSDGPLWDIEVRNEIGKCTDPWWTIPLAVNNWIISSNRLCILVSWYAAVNIQLSVLGGILLLIYCKNKRIGMHMVILIFLTFTAITFAIAYHHNYRGVFKTYMMLSQYFEKHRESINFYAASYTKVGPYLFGFICALVIKLLNEKNEKALIFSKKQLYILGTLGLLLSVGTLNSSDICYLLEQTFGTLGNAVYATSYQTLLVSGYAILLSIYFASSKDIVHTSFIGQIFIPLGRLSYSVYLSNIIMQFYSTNSQGEVISTPSSMNMTWLLCGDIICSYMLGLLVHLFIEAPLANISKFIREKVLKKCGESASIDHANRLVNASTQILTNCSIEDIPYR